jgi:hypothetical protein
VIECPDKPKLVDLVKAMGPMQAWTLSQWQKQPKNWQKQDNIPSYCIYMGSASFDSGRERVDFYHYESVEDYSTAIVFGDSAGDYRSGWPELAAKRDFYKEQLRREFKCGFLTVDDLVRVGIAALGVERESSDYIKSPRSNFRLGAEQDEPEQMVGFSESDGNEAVGGDKLQHPIATKIRMSCWDGWGIWFLCFFALFLMATACGGTSFAWYSVGWIDWGTHGLGFVGLVGVLTASWWIGRGQKYVRVTKS